MDQSEFMNLQAGPIRLYGNGGWSWTALVKNEKTPSFIYYNKTKIHTVEKTLTGNEKQLHSNLVQMKLNQQICLIQQNKNLWQKTINLKNFGK